MKPYERTTTWTGHVKSYINPFHANCIWIVVYHVITHEYQNIGYTQLSTSACYFDMVNVSKD